MEIKKLMIANRGEIALRIIRSAHKLGIPTVALTTKAERGAQHAKLADEVIEIGDGPSNTSYLNMDKIIEAAVKTNTSAIHPGYGFLSQSVEFVRRAEENGIIFVGPSTEAMQKMGSKSWSKRIMSESGVPVIQGYHGDEQNPDFLFERAKEIGFPVMIKATMGGGGKGMRLSLSPEDFHASLVSAKNEAKGAFGDDSMIIEKFVVDPKHIEIQIIADNYGNAFHLFERDCSIQRRHQKIIEEGPSKLSPEVIRQIREMGVRAAKSVNYSNAGTVEFLFEPKTGRFYFMEMNTRLQVEHPVSEMITGVDIVDLQLKVAGGASLKDLRIPEAPLGHAIEARICAEDPFNSFLPTTGKISLMQFNGKTVKDSSATMDFELGKNQHVRLDTSLIEGSQITPFYDSMIGKLIVFGENRAEALRLLEASLRQLKIAGVQTNIPFLLNLFKEQAFIDFEYSLDYFEKNKGVLLKEAEFDVGVLMAFAAVEKLFPGDFQENSGSLVNFRNNSRIKKMYRFKMEKAYSLTQEDQLFVVRVDQVSPGRNTFTITIESGTPNSSKHHEVEIIEKAGERIVLRFNSQIISKTIYSTGNNKLFYNEGVFYKIKDFTYEAVSESAKEGISNLIRAPMPGTITAINCKTGDLVKKGSPLVTIEAMKMEHKVLAKCDLRVMQVNYAEKSFVEMGATIIETEPVN